MKEKRNMDPLSVCECQSSLMVHGQELYWNRIGERKKERGKTGERRERERMKRREHLFIVCKIRFVSFGESETENRGK